MQEIDSTLASSAPLTPRRRRSLFRRLVVVYYILLGLLLLALIPPLISVNRYQRRIAMSIGQSLGRPVHLDKVSLSVLPLPGFTIENLVVSEDPAFGSEPVIRANSVRANLRVSSLWRRQVEFSSISFTEPSVNLVRLSNGKWNLESIFLQAARIQAAPTAQRTAGPAPRFPYIEATAARLNVKIGQEKMPISLNDADFALWEPNPQQWRIRIEAHPARTDTSVSDTGTFRLEATLGRAPDLGQVPLNLDAEWRTVPLGAASHFLLGDDAGIRGEMNLTAHAQGTLGNSALTTRLRLEGLRRADFVPERPLSVDLQCQSTATSAFHTFNDLQCAWTPTGSSQPIVLTATIPDVRDLNSATAKVGTPGLPVATTLDWLRIVSNRVPADLTSNGALTASIESAAGMAARWPQWNPYWTGGMKFTGITLSSPQSGLSPITIDDLTFQTPQFQIAQLESPQFQIPQTTPPAKLPAVLRARQPQTTTAATGFILAPAAIPLGGKEPATLEGRLDATGYELHLTGMAVFSRLLALGKAVPQFGDGLAEILPDDRAAGPVRIDLTATRPWNGPQTWQDNAAHPRPTGSRPTGSSATHRRHPR
jgi:AsmA protein